MAYGDFKALNRRTAADNVLRDKAFNIAKNPKHDEYQCGLASMLYNFLIKKVKVVLLKKIMQNEELAKELRKPILRKFEKRKVHSSFIDNIWDTELLLISIAIMHGLFLQKIKKALQLLMLFKKF